MELNECKGMKCLYWSSQNVNNNDGVSNKIKAHIKSLQHLMFNTYLLYDVCKGNNSIYYLNDSEFFVQSNTRFIHRLCKIILFIKLYRFVKKTNVKLIYIRYGADADFLLIKWLSKCKRDGCKIMLEIPTYPYDGEFVNLTKKQIKYRRREVYYRNKLKDCIDCIVTTSNSNPIFGVKTINISNGIDIDTIPVSKAIKMTDTVNLIAVAHIAFWHGFDRLIKGINNYYSNKPTINVNLTIVGGGHSDVIEELALMVKSYQLENHIELIGPKMGAELDAVFVGKHMAVGCLACHRKGITEVKSLKNVEYATRGIPFMYSENNTDFDDAPYVLKVPADDSDIDINSIIDFLSKYDLSPQYVRNSVSHLSWNCQFEKMIKEL